jgi:hypothetical protein
MRENERRVGIIVAVSSATIRRAQSRVVRCQQCDRTADTRFDSVLRECSAAPEGAEFLMSEAARCPTCESAIFEGDFVELLELPRF